MAWRFKSLGFSVQLSVAIGTQLCQGWLPLHRFAVHLYAGALVWDGTVMSGRSFGGPCHCDGPIIMQMSSCTCTSACPVPARCRPTLLFDAMCRLRDWYEGKLKFQGARHDLQPGQTIFRRCRKSKHPSFPRTAVSVSPSCKNKARHSWHGATAWPFSSPPGSVHPRSRPDHNGI